MPRNRQVLVPVGNTLTELTAGDATNVTFRNVGEKRLEIFPSASATAPDIDVVGRGMPVDPGEGLVGYALADVFPGLSGVVRIFCLSEYEGGSMFVSHD